MKSGPSVRPALICGVAMLSGHFSMRLSSWPLQSPGKLRVLENPSPCWDQTLTQHWMGFKYWMPVGLWPYKERPRLCCKPPLQGPCWQVVLRTSHPEAIRSTG